MNISKNIIMNHNYFNTVKCIFLEKLFLSKIIQWIIFNFWNTVKIESKLNDNKENQRQSNKKISLTLMSKEDLDDYVEIALSFRLVCNFNEWI